MIYFDSLADAISMGGHGPYVWASYLITGIVIAMLMARPMRSITMMRKQHLASAARQQRAHRSSNAPRS